MKNKQVILTLCLALLSQIGIAQLYEVHLTQRIDKSAYIFEGKVMESNSFYGPDKRMIYTSHLVQVYSVFKGQYAGDQVEIITAGGQVGNSAVELTHNLELRPNQHGIFFANPTTRPSHRQPNSGLSLRVYAGLQGFIQFHFDGINPKAAEPFRAYRHPETDLFPLIESRTGQSRQNWPATQRTAQDFYVEYIFSYPQLSSSGGSTYLNFEVQAQVNGGSYEFGDAGIYIEYDTAILGSSLAGAGKVSVSAGDITSSTDYAFAATDYGTNILEINIDAADPPINLGDVDAWADDVIKVQVDVSGINPAIEALFEQSLMGGESYYYDPVSGVYVQFPFVWAVDSVVYQASGAIKIDSIYPTILTAGTFDTLYIEGSGFGNIAGYFYFTNADEGLFSYTEAALSDMVWSDTLIKVHVFSRGVFDNGVAGTGDFQLITFTGDTLSSSPILLIQYAINNRRSSTFQSYLYTLSDFDADNIFMFYLNDKIGLSSDTADIIRECLLKWQCVTDIDWELSNQVRPEDTLGDDGYNLIFFSDSTQNGLDAGTLMSTLLRSQDCSDNGNTYRYVFETDIVINQQYPWAFLSGSTSVGSNQQDFYSTMLHELGHAHLLKHALFDNKVMYPFQGLGDSLRTLQSDDIAGGLWIIDSITTSRPNCPPIVGQNFGVDCSSVNSIEEQISSPIELNVFPNPLSKQSSLVVQTILPGDYQLSLFDAVGQIIWEKSGSISSQRLEQDLSISGSSGLYFLRLEMHGYSITKVLIK